MLHADDRWAINDTMSLHGHILDGGHFDRLEEIFTPEVIYDMTAVGMGAFEGLETIRAAARQMQDRGIGPVAHHVSNVVIISEEGDAVTVDSMGLMIMSDGAVESVTHRDTVRRHDGGWRISRRIIAPLRPAAHAPAAER